MFDIAEVAAIKQDVPKADVHILDAGHFALDESASDIAKLMRNFLGRLPRAASKAAAMRLGATSRQESAAIGIVSPRCWAAWPDLHWHMVWAR